jgi:hypothetical protein
MKTNLELLEIMVEHKDKFKGGIMGWLRNLRDNTLITDKEYDKLANFMNLYIPKWQRNFTLEELTEFGEYGNISGRLDFLNYHIKRLSIKK